MGYRLWPRKALELWGVDRDLGQASALSVPVSPLVVGFVRGPACGAAQVVSGYLWSVSVTFVVTGSVTGRVLVRPWDLQVGTVRPAEKGALPWRGGLEGSHPGLR